MDSANEEIASLRNDNTSKVQSLLALEKPQVSTRQSLSLKDKDEIEHLRKERERERGGGGGGGGLFTLVQTLESSLHSLKEKVQSEPTMKSGYKKELGDVKMTAEILLGSEEDKRIRSQCRKQTQKTPFLMMCGSPSCLDDSHLNKAVKRMFNYYEKSA